MRYKRDVGEKTKKSFRNKQVGIPRQAQCPILMIVGNGFVNFRDRSFFMGGEGGGGIRKFFELKGGGGASQKLKAEEIFYR